MIPTLTTARLTLRPFDPADAAPLHRIYHGEDVLRYFPNPVPPAFERVEHFIAAQLPHWTEHGYGNWAIVLSGQSELIGWAGLWWIAETGETEVGYLLGREQWGQGYASEAALASVTFGIEQCRLEQIIGLTHPDNLASQRVLEKCGLRFDNRQTYFGMLMTRYVLCKSAAG